MRTKLNTGDVLRVKTKQSYAYIQYINEDEEYGSLMRKISGKFDSLVEDEILVSLTKKPTDFYFYFPLQITFNASMKNRSTKEGNKIDMVLVGNYNIPDIDQFPQLLEGQSGNWWLKLQDKEEYIGEELNKETIGLSMAEIINYEMLIRRIDEDYLPKNDPRIMNSDG